jgi:hypothetical protein
MNANKQQAAVGEIRLKIAQRANESAHEKVVGFLCMLLILLTFTDLSFAHEFYSQ